MPDKQAVTSLRPFATVHTVHNSVTRLAEKYKIIDHITGEHLSPYHKYESDAWQAALTNLRER